MKPHRLVRLALVSMTIMLAGLFSCSLPGCADQQSTAAYKTSLTADQAAATQATADKAKADAAQAATAAAQTKALADQLAASKAANQALLDQQAAALATADQAAKDRAAASQAAADQANAQLKASSDALAATITTLTTATNALNTSNQAVAAADADLALKTKAYNDSINESIATIKQGTTAASTVAGALPIYGAPAVAILGVIGSIAGVIGTMGYKKQAANNQDAADQNAALAQAKSDAVDTLASNLSVLGSYVKDLHANSTTPPKVPTNVTASLKLADAVDTSDHATTVAAVNAPAIAA